jgi:hypothetical protein
LKEFRTVNWIVIQKEIDVSGVGIVFKSTHFKIKFCIKREAASTEVPAALLSLHQPESRLLRRWGEDWVVVPVQALHEPEAHDSENHQGHAGEK